MTWMFGMYRVKVCCFGAVLSIWLFCSLVLVGADVTDPLEVDALRAIKSRLIDTHRFLGNWKKGDPCLRNWTGVMCFDTALDDGYLHVRELHLLNKNLSGALAPELGHLTRLQILDFMWNNLSGNIPKEIGNLKSLDLLLLNGNKLSGFLPDELGYLPNLDRLQVDENLIYGPIPKSFANLSRVKHLHLNNNSISGQLPPELSRLLRLMHLLMDNNNLSGYLPPEFSEMPRLRILQLDNNNFSGNIIPASYGNMTRLLKLSLRNCSLQGSIPDLSAIPELGYLDLSWNHLNGSIPSNRLSENVTTIFLSHNNLSGVVPASLSGLPLLQRLSLSNNFLSGSFPSTLWVNVTLGGNRTLILDLENNLLSNVTGPADPPANVTVMLQGNPICRSANELNVTQFCGSQNATDKPLPESHRVCPLQACPTEENYEYVPEAPGTCFCAVPIRVGYRLKSPGFTDFIPYIDLFYDHLTRDVKLFRYQLHIDSFAWERGPRLRMYLKVYPELYNNSLKSSSLFNDSELMRLTGILSTWAVPESPIFGPYELLNFTLLPPYVNVFGEPTAGKGINKGALAGILVGAIALAIAVSSIITVIIMRRQSRKRRSISKTRLSSRAQIKIDGVKGFAYGEMSRATNNFCNTVQVGQGGYGKVYRGTLRDGTVVAIKRAQEGSLQGEKEFLTEIELLSRLHHRNLVSLLGYCDEEGEQMLVYEFMPNGTLRDHLSAAKSKDPLSFALRVRIALGAAKGILYLHTEADPPIFHRDIKASNILLDSKFIAKVADFGLSRLAPVTDEEGSVLGISTVVKGTPGYLDPQYFLTHKLTDKSDVYSLGVVFLELLTGMHPIYHGKNLAREVNVAYQSGMIFSIVDSRMGSYPSECVEQFVTLALQCCQEETSGRPSMAEVVRELEQIWRMTPKFDISQSDSLTNDTEMSVSPRPVSWETSADQSISTDIIGSDLVSGVHPLIRPR